ncbi:MAG: 50S ribosomal protein L11 methyltransferase [Pseudomonadota bacterium]
MPESWKITLPCTRAEAEQLAEQELSESSTNLKLSIVTREVDAAEPDIWAIDIYADARPTRELLARLTELSPSALAAKTKPEVEKLPDADWVSLSQEGLEPISAGRFHVHTGNDAPLSDPDVVNLQIDAGQAFGTGHHETTLGCLKTLDHLRSQGRHFRNIIDVGTGTGLLAMAARHLWPVARLMASDVDPVAVEVGRRNVALNGFQTGTGRHAIAMVASNGLDDRTIRQRAPFDLIIANILARPLIGLAPQISAAAAPGSILILAGLLTEQQEEVVKTYKHNGFRLQTTHLVDQWPCLILQRCPDYRNRRALRQIRSPLPETYFGEW